MFSADNKSAYDATIRLADVNGLQGVVNASLMLRSQAVETQDDDLRKRPTYKKSVIYQEVT